MGKANSSAVIRAIMPSSRDIGIRVNISSRITRSDQSERPRSPSKTPETAPSFCGHTPSQRRYCFQAGTSRPNCSLMIAAASSLLIVDSLNLSATINIYHRARNETNGEKDYNGYQKEGGYNQQHSSDNVGAHLIPFTIRTLAILKWLSYMIYLYRLFQAGTCSSRGLLLNPLAPRVSAKRGIALA